MTDITPVERMLPAFSEVLALCAVDASQKVAVLSEGELLQNYSEGFLRAAEQLGAETARVNVAASSNAGAEARIADLGTSALAGDDAAMATLKQADLVVDLDLGHRRLADRQRVEIGERRAHRELCVCGAEVGVLTASGDQSEHQESAMHVRVLVSEP